jgi:hypothetical protein
LLWWGKGFLLFLTTPSRSYLSLRIL